jgi:DNA polymerase III subunit gamma/tau
VSGALALRYRPARFGGELGVAGQKPAVALLYLMCKRGTVPGGVLLYGERGCGKTTMARIVAKALNCDAEPGPASAWPCGTCPNCAAVDNDTHPDVEEVDAASNGSVEQVREIRTRAYYGTVSGRRKVYIIDEAHGLSGPAFESLLKILEEPPPGVVFILVTTQFGSIPRTVRSRCSPFRFDPLPVGVIRDRLAVICEAEGLTIEPALLTAIAEASAGGMRDAVVRLDQVASVGIGSLEMWRELTGETDFAPALLAAAADGDAAAMYAAMDAALSCYGDPGQVARQLVLCLRDLQVLSCGGDVSAQGAALAARQDLIARLGPVRVSAAMGVLWDLHARVRVDDRETALTLALSVVARKLAPREQAAPIAAGGGERASVDFMREALGSV